MSAFPQIAMYGHYIQKWSIQLSLLLIRFVFSECWLKLIYAELHVTIMITYWNSILLKCHITNKIMKLHLRNKAQLLNPEHNSQSRNIYANICNKPFSTCINMEYMQYVHLTLPRISLLSYKLWKLLPQNWKHLYLAHSWIKKDMRNSAPIMCESHESSFQCTVDSFVVDTICIEQPMAMLLYVWHWELPAAAAVWMLWGCKTLRLTPVTVLEEHLVSLFVGGEPVCC